MVYVIFSNLNIVYEYILHTPGEIWGWTWQNLLLPGRTTNEGTEKGCIILSHLIYLMLCLQLSIDSKNKMRSSHSDVDVLPFSIIEFITKVDSIADSNQAAMQIQSSIFQKQTEIGIA